MQVGHAVPRLGLKHKDVAAVGYCITPVGPPGGLQEFVHGWQFMIDSRKPNREIDDRFREQSNHRRRTDLLDAGHFAHALLSDVISETRTGVDPLLICSIQSECVVAETKPYVC